MPKVAAAEAHDGTNWPQTLRHWVGDGRHWAGISGCLLCAVPVAVASALLNAK